MIFQGIKNTGIDSDFSLFFCKTDLETHAHVITKHSSVDLVFFLAGGGGGRGRGGGGVEGCLHIYIYTCIHTYIHTYL